MAKNKLICNGVTFTEEKIKSGSVFLSNSIAFEELRVDTLDMELDLSEETGTIFAPADADGLLTSDNRLFTVHPYFHILATDPTQFTYGKRVEYYRDNVIFSVFYMSSIRRVSKFFYAISCVSAVGLLGNILHYGGMYTGQTMDVVLREIIGSAFPYSVASNVNRIRVYGWLPVSTCRDNLRQLLFANGVAIKKSNNGNVSFELLNTSVPFQIPDNRLMLGGSVDYPAAASEAVVIEHSFFSTAMDETETLYDGAVSASTFVSPNGVTRNGILVTFEHPVHSLSASGVSILESGVNYAVLSPGGHAILTGKKYTHTTREVRQTISQDASGMAGDKNVARVEDATLVNAINSEAVTSRVASYYSSARKIKSKMLVDAERPGDFVAFQNPFYEPDEGLISSMDINISGTLLAETEIVAGYTPVSGGTYENVVLLTGSGTFTVPAGKEKIHVVVIGGAQGGYSGHSGKLASGGTTKYAHPRITSREMWLTVGTGGDGGLPGEGGRSGNIYQTTLNVVPLTTFSYRCGAGGVGGVSEKDRSVDNDYSRPGANGSDTIFGPCSSASGSPSDYGYLDIITGTTYGGRGYSGIAGGKGAGYLGGENDGLLDGFSPGTPVVFNGITYYSGPNVIDEDGNVSIVYKSSTAIIGYYEGDKTKPNTYSLSAAASYGAGGGAAAGRNGNIATDPPSASARATSSASGSANATGGAGGTGADAVSPPKETRYGVGGRGGNGGGGQGGAGFADAAAHKGVFVTNTNDPSQDPGSVPGKLVQKTAAGRGLGSNGGVGGDGCILVYY